MIAEVWNWFQSRHKNFQNCKNVNLIAFFFWKKWFNVQPPYVVVFRSLSVFHIFSHLKCAIKAIGFRLRVPSFKFNRVQLNLWNCNSHAFANEQLSWLQIIFLRYNLCGIMSPQLAWLIKHNCYHFLIYYFVSFVSLIISHTLYVL